MQATSLVNTGENSRSLMQLLRRGVDDDGVLPESVAWQVFIELKKRGEPRAARLFVGALRSLHSRRSLAGATLPVTDSCRDEHRLSDDPFLADLWKAYKKCIEYRRTGPMSQLLRDIETQVS